MEGAGGGVEGNRAAERWHKGGEKSRKGDIIIGTRGDIYQGDTGVKGDTRVI